MSDNDLYQQLEEARGTVRALQYELAETNRGLVALTMELEKRVEARTGELRAAHAELAKTNSELMQLTIELEDRVAERTAQLQLKDEEVKAMTQQLWQAAKLATMGELAASIAHELNNPLATVTLRIESLLAQTLSDDDSKRHSLEVIEQEVERMANLVANLLQFSRRGTKQVSMLDLGEEIVNTLELIQYHLRNRGIEIVQKFAPNMPKTTADRQLLRQLFLNLFTNASDAMPQGGTLTIRVRLAGTDFRSDLESNHRRLPQQIGIEIADTGVGIAPENLSRLAEPFFTTKPEGKGTGLGLAICRRIVQDHGGTLNITSELCKGTTVRISLPVQA